MKKELKHIVITWLLLFTILPSLIGTALVHHHCDTCDHSHTEAALLVLPHDHNTEPCICETKCEVNVTTLHDHEHQHHCQVDLKKIDIPLNLTQPEELLPLLISIDLLSHKDFIGSILSHEPLLSPNSVFKEAPPLLFLSYKGGHRQSILETFLL